MPDKIGVLSVVFCVITLHASAASEDRIRDLPAVNDPPDYSQPIPPSSSEKEQDVSPPKKSKSNHRGILYLGLGIAFNKVFIPETGVYGSGIVPNFHLEFDLHAPKQNRVINHTLYFNASPVSIWYEPDFLESSPELIIRNYQFQYALKVNKSLADHNQLYLFTGFLSGINIQHLSRAISYANPFAEQYGSILIGLPFGWRYLPFPNLAIIPYGSISIEMFGRWAVISGEGNKWASTPFGTFIKVGVHLQYDLSTRWILRFMVLSQAHFVFGVPLGTPGDSIYITPQIDSRLLMNGCAGMKF